MMYIQHVLTVTAPANFVTPHTSETTTILVCYLYAGGDGVPVTAGGRRRTAGGAGDGVGGKERGTGAPARWGPAVSDRR